MVAPDSFKGSLAAAEVAAAIGRGIAATAPGWDIHLAPIADGGEGTLDAAYSAGYLRVPIEASGPLGDRVQTAYARSGDTAIVELADICGLSRLPDASLHPLDSSTRGLGESVRAAVAAGCRTVVLGLGGSASSDGGAGMLTALGATLTDSLGRSLPDGGAALAQAAHLELTELRGSLRGVELIVAGDVDNPLVGPTGAAAVFAPQKGATPAQVEQLGLSLERWADIVATATGRDVRHDPGTGVAGGTAFAAMAVLGAARRPGAHVVLDLLDFRAVVKDADLVIVGEGCLDQQTLRGKAPVGAARTARQQGVRVVAVCGRRDLPDEVLSEHGMTTVYACTDFARDDENPMREAARILQRIGERIGNELTW